MSNRKRHTARPILEPMEHRVTPSVMGIQAHHGQAVAAHVGQMNNPIKQAKASQYANNEALKRLQQQEHLVHIHSMQRTPSALPTPAEKAASEISNVFQSIGKIAVSPAGKAKTSTHLPVAGRAIRFLSDLTGSSRTL